MCLESKVSPVQKTVVVLLALIATSCRTHPAQKSKADPLPVEIEHSARARVVWAEAYRHGNNLVLHGALQQSQNNNQPVPTHLDITLLDAAGQIVAEHISPIIYVPRRIPGHGPNFRHFDVTIDSVPLKAQTVRALLHDTPHRDNT